MMILVGKPLEMVYESAPEYFQSQILEQPGQYLGCRQVLLFDQKFLQQIADLLVALIALRNKDAVLAGRLPLSR